MWVNTRVLPNSNGKAGPFIENRDIANWNDFEQWIESVSTGERMAYRGHENCSWTLQTSLERFCSRLHHSMSVHEVQASTEEVLTSEFKRGAHHFNVEPHKENDEFGWVALMRHFGAPTMLLDWTESAYVALDNFRTVNLISLPI